MPMNPMIEITTPLGNDVLLFHRMHAQEELSRLFEFEIDLLSTQPDIDINKILGQNVTVKLELADGKFRHFNGFVSRFAQVGPHGSRHAYHAVVRPWMWFLTRASNCRIFQGQTVPDIIANVFANYSVADFKNSLTGSYRVWEYCVQYRESDFNFVCRLMEQEGIYFYFDHQDGRHTLVLADSPGAHSPVAGYEKIPFVADNPAAGPESEHIEAWEFAREIQSDSYVIDDFDFKRPNVELQVKASTSLGRRRRAAEYEVYDYPGEYVTANEGKHYAQVRMGALDSEFEQARAHTNARGVSVGHLFKLTAHPRADQNREYLVLATMQRFELDQTESTDNPGTSYHCELIALQSRQIYRPQPSMEKPMVQGPQTAIVVGPPGEEIFTDEYGRVKVRFHWDRGGQRDETSSCWMRVSQPWAGHNWGMIAIPRIGQEVIVDFLEGDPDRPIITGCVYNAARMPPYALPSNKTQTGIKTHSSPGGGNANFNEIRFEDKKGAEQLFIHAEKNQDTEVENDETHWVGHDRTKTVDHDEASRIQHDRTATVGNDEAVTIGVDRTKAVGRNESISIGANETLAIGGAWEIDVGASQVVNVAANQSQAIGRNQTSAVGSNRAADIGGNDSLRVGKNLVIEAGDSVTIKTGSAMSVFAAMEPFRFRRKGATEFPA